MGHIEDVTSVGAIALKNTISPYRARYGCMDIGVEEGNRSQGGAGDGVVQRGRPLAL